MVAGSRSRSSSKASAGLATIVPKWISSSALTPVPSSRRETLELARVRSRMAK